jgi:riboflavin kinase / FMN adenylyltransferase
LERAWLTIGVFDGVHRGHREILSGLVRAAHAQNASAAVLTFAPHPAVVLGGKTDFHWLTPPDERAERLEELGVDAVINQAFDRTFADQSAEKFMERVKQTIDLQTLVIGYDTALGRGRQGDAARLREIGQSLGFSVESIGPLRDERGVISSTRIREAVKAGQVSTAAADLGYSYTITGPVIHGDGRGHTIDVPTANIQAPDGKLLPANGIYATWAWVDGRRIAAATNVGIRPTFTPDLMIPTVEAHLLDFNQDLYGKRIKLEFVEYLRPEEKYDSIHALVNQIILDVKVTREKLGIA